MAPSHSTTDELVETTLDALAVRLGLGPRTEVPHYRIIHDRASDRYWYRSLGA